MTAPAIAHKADLRQRLESGPTPIALSFSDAVTDLDLKSVLADGLDVAEVRLDRFSAHNPDHVLSNVRRFVAFPTIATIRTHAEGGDWQGTDAERLELFRLILPEVDAIDIELSSTEIRSAVVSAAQSLGKMVIVSKHDFESTPPVSRLVDIACEAKEVGADFVKIATMTSSLQDVRTLAEFTLQNSPLGLIVIAMGAHGTVSRVFFPALGSRLTYAHLGDRPVSGQLTFRETFEMMKTCYPDFREQKTVDMQTLDGA